MGVLVQRLPHVLNLGPDIVQRTEMDPRAFHRYVESMMIGEVSPRARLSGVDWDHATKERGVYRMTNKNWSPRVDDELGNYDYLLGVDVRLLCIPYTGGY